MSAKNFVIKHNYLLRFVSTLFIALYIPLIIFGFTVIRRSYNEMIRRNEDYYRETTASFVTYFDEQLNILRNHALTIAIDSTEAGNEITKAVTESHPYYYFTASIALADYKIGLPNINDIGLHFFGTDYILTSKYKYTIDYFFKSGTNNSTELIRQITDFFDADNNTTVMISTFPYREYENAALFVGIPVALNKHHKALIFYMLKYDSISTSFFGTQSSDQLRLCIFDDDGSLVYTNTTSDIGLLENKDFKGFITDTGNDTSIFQYNNNRNNYTVFKVRNENLGKVFISVVPQDEVEESFRQFYCIMRNNTILIALGFIPMLAVAVYINYRPIMQLVRSIINKQGNIGIDSEIGTITRAFDQISHAFDQMEEYVSEQRIMLMDYFLGNLLYGIPIPQADAERLDISLHGGSFCVLAVSDLKMNTQEREQLAGHIMLKCNIHVYITDILYKNHMVLICVLKDDDLSKPVRELKQYLHSKYSLPYQVGAGHIVHQLDDIRKSYMNALHAMESISINPDAADSGLSFDEGYPSEDIMLFLQYVQMGELENALRTLDSILQYIANEIETVLLQRYMYYDILIAYIKCLKQMKYPLGRKETTDLLSNSNAKELYEALSASVKLVCESVAHNAGDMDDSLQKDILDYINENFTDPDICRTQVADKFGISIYSLSRLFKDIVGIGFKEYISAKRMELSRQLLLTSDKSIVKITADIGFDDPDYFSKLFKASYGVTPSKFRRQ